MCFEKLRSLSGCCQAIPHFHLGDEYMIRLSAVSNCGEMFINSNYNMKCTISFFYFLFEKSQPAGWCFVDTLCRRYSRDKGWYTDRECFVSPVLTEHDREDFRETALPDGRLFLHGYCLRNASEYVSFICVKTYQTFLHAILWYRSYSLSHLCRCKLYLGPAASSTQGRNNSTDLRRRLPLPNLWYVNVWNIVILRHGSR